MARLFQVFNNTVTGKRALFRVRTVSKNGQISNWTSWKSAIAGDTVPPDLPTASDITFTAIIGQLKFQLTSSFIAAADADIVQYRWYVQSRTGSGSLAFDSSWTPTAILSNETYTFNFPVTYDANTYWHIWCIPVDIMGNWDSTPGAAQHQNKRPLTVDASDIDDASILGWTFTGTFSSSNNTTVAWTAGTLTLSNGDSYSILSGNTGAMAAVTYIYFDSSYTSLQITTTAANAVGANKILVAVAQNVADATKKAIFQVFGGTGGNSPMIYGYNIVGNTITGNEIAGNEITGTHIKSTTISTSNLAFTPIVSAGGTGAIVATINASSEGLRISGGLIEVTGSVSFASGYDPTTKTAKVGGTYDSAASGARVRIFPDANTGLLLTTGTRDVFKAFVDGLNVGDVIIGDTSGSYFQWDDSASLMKMIADQFQLISTNNYWRVIQSSSNCLMECSTPATGSDTTLWGMFATYNSVADRSYGYMYAQRVVHSTGDVKELINLSPYYSDGATEAPSLRFWSDEGTAFIAFIRMETSDGLLKIISGGDILIDPAGGDVDFDACDVWIDSGKHLSLNGSTDSVYIVYNSGDSRVDVTSKVNATGGFANNGTSGTSGTFTSADSKTITVAGGIITNIAA